MIFDSFTLSNNNVFVVSSGLLIIGFIFGWIINKINLPRVTGYIIAGILFGPSLFNFFNDSTLVRLEFIPELALGVIALIIGAGLSFDLIKRLKFRLLIILFFESMGAFFLVFFGLLLFKMPLGAILPLSAIAAATAPAATLSVVKEFRSSGPVTETALAVIALDDAVAIILFGLVMTFDFNHLSSFGSAAIKSISTSFFEIFLAFIIGVSLAWFAYLLIKISRENTDSLIIILGAILLAIGLSSIFNVSSLLTNIFLGVSLINISSKNSDIITNLEKMTPPIYCLFFVLAGAHLNVGVFSTVGWGILLWSVVFVFARIIGKVSGTYVAGVISKAPDAMRKYLGLTLAPQAGVAIGLSLLITGSSSYFDYRSIILNVTIIGVAFNELFGPALTKYALFSAGEAEEVREKQHRLPLEFKR